MADGSRIMEQAPEGTLVREMGGGMPLGKPGGSGMERLNALEWADGASLTIFGIRMGIRATLPETLPKLLTQLPPGWRFSATRKVQWMYSLSSVASRRHPGKQIHHLYTEGVLLTRGSNFPRIQAAFGADLRSLLSLLSPWRIFIHSGAVGWKGRAILLPGDSGSGKTTLTAALVRAGATLLSDEYAVLDRAGRAHPYPLPLRVKTGDGPGATRVPVEELGGVAERKPLPVKLILATRFAPEAKGQLRRLSPGRGALLLLAHANQARSRSERVMETVAAASRNADVLQGPRGEADTIVDRILSSW